MHIEGAWTRCDDAFSPTLTSSASFLCLCLRQALLLPSVVGLYLYLKLQSVMEENEAAWTKVAELREKYNNARISYNMAGTEISHTYIDR